MQSRICHVDAFLTHSKYSLKQQLWSLQKVIQTSLQINHAPFHSQLRAFTLSKKPDYPAV